MSNIILEKNIKMNQNIQEKEMKDTNTYKVSNIYGKKTITDIIKELLSSKIKGI